MKKVLALVLAAILILGCVPALAELNLVSGEGVYPLKTDVTLSWYVGDGYVLNDAYATWQDSPFHTGLIEQTGVNIDWSFPTVGADRNAAFNTLMSSEQLPDIICYYFMNDASRYLEEGVIRDLTPYIQQYAPAYYAFLQSNPVYDKAMKTDDGKYYAFGFFREDGGWNDTYLGPVIRQDWLKECGLEAPKTISDWDKVLRTFNEKYGAKLSFAWTRFNTTGISGAFGAFGASTLQYYIDEAGKVQLAQAQPEWAAYVKQLNKWWADGLIDQDIFTLDDTGAKTKALNGEIGIGITSMGQLSNWVKEAQAAGNGADWIGLQYPTGDDGKLSMVFGGTGVGTNVGVVTSSCTDEELETALRVLDYAYTKEGFLYWNYGKQGVSWDYGADGKPAYTELVTKDPDGLNNAISKFGGTTWSGNCLQSTNLLYMKNTPVSIAANDLWFYPNEAVTSKWKMPSGFTQTTDESDDLDLYVTQLTTYVAESFAKFVTGEASIDTDFAAFQAKLDEMGLQKVLELRQAAYDRYLAR